MAPAAQEPARARRRPSLRALATVALASMVVATAATFAGALDELERESLSARFAVREAPQPRDIAVVAIDDATFSDLEVQWPFRRSLHAKVVDRLHEAGAREIVYDVQFTEPTKPAQDLALFDAIDRAGGAVLATSESDGRGGTNVLGGDDNLDMIGARAGASNLSNDGEGVVTRYPRSVEGLDSLATVTAKRLGTAPAGGFREDGALIDYRGGPGTFDTHSFSAVVRGDFPPDAFRGKVVVVGAAAPTLRDVHATPVGRAELMAGAEVQANAIWTAVHGNPLRSVAAHWNLLLILLLGLVAPLARLRLSVVPAAAIALLSGALYLVAAQLAFGAGVVLAVAAPLLSLVAAGVLTVVVSHLTETRERRRVVRDNELLEERVRERTAELRDTQLEIAQRLGAAVESRDIETGLHVDRISMLCHRLALTLGMSEAEAELLRDASVLHDVGKIAIPDHVLGKPGNLDADEWEIVKRHPVVGGRILAGSRSPVIQLAETIALTHHERFDGSGYPRGLRGDEIPLAGRICAICDVFDALLSKRPYKSAWSFEDTVKEIADGAGSHFDPRLVETFLPMTPALYAEWSSLQELVVPHELSADAARAPLRV